MTIRYAFDDRPEQGQLQTITPGIEWLRMPLPFMLGHINLWLLQDDAGWAIVDTGLGTDDSLSVWRDALAAASPTQPVKRIIVTHLHPDHVGCAGALAEEHGVELWMTRSEYLLCRVLVADTGREAPEAGVRFYHAAGFDAESLQRYRDKFGLFGRAVKALPDAYRRMQDGDTLVIGAHRWEVIVGRGHSPEHACLFDSERNLLIAGDQLLPTISSNVSVYPTEPEADPLDDWLSSLRALRTRLPDDVLVLPAHGKPFFGAYERIDALIKEHEDGLEKVLALCATPQRAVDTFDALFKSKISAGNLIMATGEAVAHLHYLRYAGEIRRSTDDDGVHWYERSG